MESLFIFFSHTQARKSLVVLTNCCINFMHFFVHPFQNLAVLSSMPYVSSKSINAMW